MAQLLVQRFALPTPDDDEQNYNGQYAGYYSNRYYIHDLLLCNLDW
jgi:hypothetical protein